MQYILSEEEYGKLIRKERIKGPVKEFVDGLNELIKREGFATSSHRPTVEIPKEHFSNLVTTLNIKLDL